MQPLQEDLLITSANCSQDNEIDVKSNARWFNSPLSMSLGEEIRKSAYTIRNVMFAGGVIKVTNNLNSVTL